VSDIRVKTSFRSNRKRKKLSKLLGYDCAGHILDLWIEASLSRCKGVLENWDEDDIAEASGWEGDPRVWTQMLLNVGFLDNNDNGTFELHDWREHQGYVFHREHRVKRARKAAAARYGEKWKKDKRDMVECSNCHSGKMPVEVLQLDEDGVCVFCRGDR